MAAFSKREKKQKKKKQKKKKQKNSKDKEYFAVLAKGRWDIVLTVCVMNALK